MAYATNFITRTWAYDYSLAIQDIEQELTLEDRKDLQPSEKGEPIKKTAIDIYEERVKGWFLEPARNLLETDPHSGFVALMVVIGFFEAQAYYLHGVNVYTSKTDAGTKTSKALFVDCFLEVMGKYIVDKDSKISEDEKVKYEVAIHIYNNIRNALFHTSIIRKWIGITGEQSHPIVFERYRNNDEQYFVSFNTIKCLDRVEQYFDEYINALRDSSNEELRNNFMIAWNSSHPLQQSVEKREQKFPIGVDSKVVSGIEISDKVSLKKVKPYLPNMGGTVIANTNPSMGDD